MEWLTASQNYMRFEHESSHRLVNARKISQTYSISLD
jgi:hypothetical protein